MQWQMIFHSRLLLTSALIAASSAALAQEPRGPEPRRIAPDTVNDPALDTTSAENQLQSVLATIGNGKIVAVFDDNASALASPLGEHESGYATSTDGGKSWTDRGTLPSSVGGDDDMPWLAVHRKSGRIYLSNTGSNSGVNSDGQIFVWRSDDGGKTWQTPVNASPGYAEPGDMDHPRIAVDNFKGNGNGNVYACFFKDDANQLLFTRSTDGGATFTPNLGTVISATGGSGCSVAVGPNHHVYVAYFRGDGSTTLDGDNKIFMRKSTDRGQTFGAEVVVADLNSTSFRGFGDDVDNGYPQIAVNPDSAKPFVYVVYSDDPLPLGDLDDGNVFLARSTNGGATWSTPQVVDGNAGSQYTPTLTFTTPSNLMISYYSKSQDSSTDNRGHARGRIGTLRPSGKVQFYPSFQLGPNTNQSSVDWHQNAADGTKVLTTWSDQRNGSAFIAEQPDVRFASINVPPDSADLKLVLKRAPGTIGTTGLSTVKATVTNLSGTATDVYVSLVGASGLSLQNAFGGDCSERLNFAGCNLGKLGSGQSKTVSLTARAAAAGSYNLQAFATTSSRETAPANNQAAKTITVTAAPEVTAQYTTGDIATATVDNGTVDVPIVVGDVGSIVKVTADIRLTHSYLSALDISLISPTGTIIDLTSDNGGASVGYGSGNNNCTGNFTTFDDAAATSVTAAGLPIVGAFIPEAPLASFANQLSSGTWILRVTDDDGFGDAGTVGCVRLNITRHP